MNSGPAGLQAAKDLAGAGVDVVVAERNSWVGGRLCQLGRVFQSEGWPSICDSVCVGPVQARGAVLSERVRLLTGADVIAAERRDGGFSVTVRQAPRYVDADRCIACDLCAQACPEEAPRAFDRGLTRRKAIDREFERALPGGYVLLDEVCTRCGDCVPVCPTDAIDLDAQPTSTTEEFGAVFLATGTTPLDLTGYSDLLATDGDVVDALTFEQLMASGLRRPSDGEEPESVVFVQCAGSRAGPDKQGQGVPYCSKTCCSVTAKQVDRLATGFPMVESTVVYYRDMRPRMFDRWRQENYFKYMRQEYALDALVEHGVEAADPSRPVPNPARKALDKELRQAKREVERLEAEYGAAAIDNPEKSGGRCAASRSRTGRRSGSRCATPEPAWRSWSSSGDRCRPTCRWARSETRWSGSLAPRSG